MGMCLRMVPRLEQRLVQRLELRQTLRAPTPPKAARGIKGMRVADAVLKKRGAVGLLIGGLAKEVWRGSTDPKDFSRHKDVDVLVLSFDCRRHPKQWEKGIDWWIRHCRYERPTNGNEIGLVWKLSLRLERGVRIRPGLYLPPLWLLEAAIHSERKLLGDDFVVRGGRFEIIRLGEFPPFPEEHLLRAKWGDDRHYVADHCKPV